MKKICLFVLLGLVGLAAMAQGSTVPLNITVELKRSSGWFYTDADCNDFTAFGTTDQGSYKAWKLNAKDDIPEDLDLKIVSVTAADGFRTAISNYAYGQTSGNGTVSSENYCLNVFGSKTGNTYTMSVAEGYYILTYTVGMRPWTSSNPLTWRAEGVSGTTNSNNANEVRLTVAPGEKNSTDFVVSGASTNGNNGTMCLTHFTVQIVNEAYLESLRNPHVGQHVISVDKTTGTQDSGTGTWFSLWSKNSAEGNTWETTAEGSEPMLWITGPQSGHNISNNLCWSGNNLGMAPGSGLNCDFRLIVAQGYQIKGYEFDFQPTSSFNATVSADGLTVSADAGAKAHFKSIPMGAAFTKLNLKASANQPVAISNFKVYVDPVELTSRELFRYDGASQRDVYRIPAIATTKSGRLVAFSDLRPGKQDVGFGDVDIYFRYSDDNGASWSAPVMLLDGDNNTESTERGFGDPAAAADRESEEVVMLCVASAIGYPQGSRDGKYPHVVMMRSLDGGDTWSAYEDISEQFYKPFDDADIPAQSMFVGSGHIAQSHKVKRGDYYRLYAALLCRVNFTPGVTTTGVNYVIYSDDFGRTWNILGDVTKPATTNVGDEPKAIELPDGSVMLSTRTPNGRVFNIWRWIDEEAGQGMWENYAVSNSANNGIVTTSACNGDTRLVPVRKVATGETIYLLLQGLPLSGGTNARDKVRLYYKAIDDYQDIVSPQAVASDWDGEFEVSALRSGYSSMTLNREGNLAIFYEEETYNMVYTQVFKTYSITEITGGEYEYFDGLVDDSRYAVPVSADIDEKIAAANGYLSRVGELGCPAVDNASVQTLREVLAAKPETVTMAYELRLKAAIDGFLTDTDVVMPAGEGHKFAFVFVTTGGDEYYMYSTANKLAGAAFNRWDEVPAEGQYALVPLDNGKFAFKNHEDKWLEWGNNNSVSGRNYPGWSDTLADATNGFTVFKMTVASSNHDNAATDDTLLGCFYIYSDQRNDVSNRGCFVFCNRDGVMDGSSAPFFNVNYTSAIRLVDITSNELLTGVDGVSASVGQQAVYDLSGRRVSAPARGLYIVGGKVFRIAAF